MRLSRLRLVNFRQHADNTLLFDSGLTGIIGPNGVGKTTILEAIKWALYGGDATRGTVDSIRFARASARAPVRIELDFDLGGHRYRLVRALTTADLYLDGGERPIATGASAVTELVRRLVRQYLGRPDRDTASTPESLRRFQKLKILALVSRSGVGSRVGNEGSGGRRGGGRARSRPWGGWEDGEGRPREGLVRWSAARVRRFAGSRGGGVGPTSTRSHQPPSVMTRRIL